MLDPAAIEQVVPLSAGLCQLSSREALDGPGPRIARRPTRAASSRRRSRLNAPVVELAVVVDALLVFHHYLLGSGTPRPSGVF